MWDIVAVKKSTGEVDGSVVFGGASGCFSALKYKSDIFRGYKNTHNFFATYNIKDEGCKEVIEFLSSADNHLPIRPGQHFLTHEVDARVPNGYVWIDLSNYNYRHTMFTKFLVINCRYVRDFSRSWDLYRTAGLPSGLALIASAAVLITRDRWGCAVRPYSSDSFVYTEAQWSFLAALLSPNLGLARELAVGTLSIVDIVLGGGNWKNAEYALNRMFRQHGISHMCNNTGQLLKREGWGQEGIGFFQSSMGGTAQLTKDSRWEEMTNCIVNFAATCYTKRTKRPSHWWKKCVMKKFPFAEVQFV